MKKGVKFHAFPTRKYLTLKTLIENNGVMTMKDLAKAMKVDRATIYSALHNYRKQGLVRNVGEKKISIWEITETGIRRYFFLKAYLEVGKNLSSFVFIPIKRDW